MKTISFFLHYCVVILYRSFSYRVRYRVYLSKNYQRSGRRALEPCAGKRKDFFGCCSRARRVVYDDGVLLRQRRRAPLEERAGTDDSREGSAAVGGKTDDRSRVNLYKTIVPDRVYATESYKLVTFKTYTLSAT